MKKIFVGISGIGSYLPEKILTNDELSKMVDTSNEWIVERTGIEQRRIVEESQATSDLAIEAGIRALENASVTPEEIDLIIVASSTPDYIFPSTACIVQHKINATKAAAFDMNVACSGFVYAMATGANFISSGAYKKVLVIGAEAFSRIMNWEDRNTCVLFGDGAGAVVLEECDQDFGILSYDLGSDGENGDVLIVPAGGSRTPASANTVNDKLHSVQMDGKAVFKFAVKTMGKSTIKALEKAGLKIEDLDFLVPHQANTRIIDSSMKKLNLSKEKVYTNLNKYGNTSSASVPIALDEAVKEGRIKKGDNIALVAFGAGLSWASIVMKWNRGDTNG